MKKVILAFDSFKGCITAAEACSATAKSIHSLLPKVQTIEIPLSDGGEGLVNCIQRLIPTRDISIVVHGPLMEEIEVNYATSTDNLTAYIEMAAAGGLTLVPENKRNPMITTTYGVGEIISDAIKRGCETIVMGIGGSATCDGGRGMIKALAENDCLNRKCEFIIACDVTNPLYGPNGAAFVFAPQKGATPQQVTMLDQQLRDFARETEALGLATLEQAYYPGTGAAGGLGYALLTYLKATLRSGIDIILDVADFDNIVKDADLVITGEGKSDAQTLMGKVPYGVLRHCQKQNIPVWLLSGAIEDPSHNLSSNFALVKSINERKSLPLSILMLPEVAKCNLANTIKRLILENVQIRRSCLEDIPRLLEIFAIARRFMEETGNPTQWADDYPSIELLKSDINSKDSYVVTLGSHIVATFVLRSGIDPTYNIIYDGEWLNDNTYATIHRIASSGELKGILSIAMQFAYQNYDDIRIDTHRNNHTMQNAVKKEGFQYCGIIHCWNGSERLAFQFSKHSSINN